MRITFGSTDWVEQTAFPNVGDQLKTWIEQKSWPHQQEWVFSTWLLWAGTSNFCFVFPVFGLKVKYWLFLGAEPAGFWTGTVPSALFGLQYATDYRYFRLLSLHNLISQFLIINHTHTHTHTCMCTLLVLFLWRTLIKHPPQCRWVLCNQLKALGAQTDFSKKEFCLKTAMSKPWLSFQPAPCPVDFKLASPYNHMSYFLN